MDTQLLIWICVAAIAAAIVLVRLFRTAHDNEPRLRHAHHHARHHAPLIEVGSEWEEFYITGDRRLVNDDQDDFGE